MAGRPEPRTKAQRAARATGASRHVELAELPVADASVRPLTALDMVAFRRLTVVDKVTLRAGPPVATATGGAVVDTAVEAGGFRSPQREGTLIGPSPSRRQKEEASRQAKLRDARAADARRRAVGPGTYSPKITAAGKASSGRIGSM